VDCWLGIRVWGRGVRMVMEWMLHGTGKGVPSRRSMGSFLLPHGNMSVSIIS
jgi:hypothetical protein